VAFTFGSANDRNTELYASVDLDDAVQELQEADEDSNLCSDPRNIFKSARVFLQRCGMTMGAGLVEAFNAHVRLWMKSNADLHGPLSEEEPGFSFRLYQTQPHPAAAPVDSTTSRPKLVAIDEQLLKNADTLRHCDYDQHEMWYMPIFDPITAEFGLAHHFLLLKSTHGHCPILRVEVDLFFTTGGYTKNTFGRDSQQHESDVLTGYASFRASSRHQLSRLGIHKEQFDKYFPHQKGSDFNMPIITIVRPVTVEYRAKCEEEQGAKMMKCLSKHRTMENNFGGKERMASTIFSLMSLQISIPSLCIRRRKRTA